MRLRIAETVPGELFSRAVEAVRVIERITGRSLLKAAPKAAPKIHKWMVLYVEPNPDGTRKQCGNCPMWVKGGGCTIHSRRHVPSSWICGYHVYGKPMDEMHKAADLDPELSGLEHAPAGGTSCDRCKYYDDRGETIIGDGSCAILGGVVVEAKACCSAWEAAEGLAKADEAARQISQSPAQFEYPVLEETVKRGSKEVERIRKLMVAKIGAVLS